jgi:glycine/D-amino acid oxidase-like deaminating enzyme
VTSSDQRLPRTASTVIVGRGIVGAATAFVLADRGERDVVVIERDTLGSGTTKGGLGGFMHAPATARLIVEEMLDGRASTLDIADLSLERFRTGRRPFAATVL